MEKRGGGQGSSDAILGHSVQLLATLVTLLSRMSAVETSSIVPGQENIVDPYAAPSTSGDDGLQPADVAAIVLGVLLLLLIIIMIIVFVLIKTGKIFSKDEKKKVAPAGLLNGFSVTPGRLKDCSFTAITKDRSLRRATSRDTDDSIIYMYDDVYHPPNSRPLPTNRVKADPYVAVTRSSARLSPRPSPRPSSRPSSRPPSRKDETPRYHSSRSKRSSHSHRDKNFDVSPRYYTPRTYTHRGATNTPPPTPEPDADAEMIPDRINITTSGRSPYINRSVRY